MPEFLATAAVEPDIRASHGALEGFLVHIAKHEDLAGIFILDDGWNQAFFVEVQVIYIYLTPCIPLSYQGEGEEFCEEGLAPLSDSPFKGEGEKYIWRGNAPLKLPFK